VELIGVGLAFSSMKESEDGAWLVVRCVNLVDETVSGRWRFPFAVRAAQLARLDETLISELEVDRNEVRFNAGPRGIVTMLVH
jgi:alpha-mannosidase